MPCIEIYGFELALTLLCLWCSTKVVTTQKLNWQAKSKIGSLENTKYKPGGGDKKIESQKLNFKDKAQSKVGSTANLKHKAGGGNVKVQ